MSRDQWMFTAANKDSLFKLPSKNHLFPYARQWNKVSLTLELYTTNHHLICEFAKKNVQEKINFTLKIILPARWCAFLHSRTVKSP